MLQIKLNTTNISSSIDWTSLQWTQVLTKEVDRLEFLIKKTSGKTVPSVGDPIYLLESTDGGSTWQKLFGGILVERNEKIVGGVLLGYACKCKDFSHTLDGQLVVKRYTNQDPHAIVADIISTYTSGFTTTNVKTGGFNVASIKFNYDQVTQALTNLANQIGWDWYVDPDKDIHFFDEETAVAPFQLDDTGGMFEWASLELNQTIVNLKNQVFVRGGDYSRTFNSSNTIDVYKTDGTQVTFPLAYGYSNITVDLDGSAQTVGVDQKDDPGTVQVLYNFNEKFIRFTSTPATGKTVKVYGDAQIPIIASVRDQVSIATYGLFQQAVINKSITSVAEAQSRAKAELEKYSENVWEGQFKTTQTGLRCGQQLTIVSSLRSLNKKFKITRVIGKARGSDHLEYQVYLLASGQVSFTDIMVGLLTQSNQNVVIADNEVLQRLETFPEDVTLVEAVTVTKGVRPYRWGPGSANDFHWNFATWS